MRFSTIYKPFLVALAMVFSSLSAASEISTGWLSSLAVSGYDTVAYFTEGKPVEGKSELETEYKGATWRFSSQENLDLFKKDPEKYAPQYGGYCAWAVAHNSTASSDPESWEIVDGKLYLNYNASIQEKWSPRKDELIPRANTNWPKVIN